MIYASLTRLIGPNRKTINDMSIKFEDFFSVFGMVWVGATLEKSKYRLPRVLGQKCGVVPWISIKLIVVVLIEHPGVLHHLTLSWPGEGRSALPNLKI